MSKEACLLEWRRGQEIPLQWMGALSVPATPAAQPRRRTYLADSSLWVALNTFVTAQMYRVASCEQAIEQFCADATPTIAVQPFVQFLRLGEEATP